MARRTTGISGKRGRITALIFALLVLSAAFIYLNELFFHIDGVPEWKDLYRYFGVGNTVDAVKDDGGTRVHFIDVGQGDCALISCEGRYVLIDCGEYEYSGRVIKYLDAVGVKQLDYIIVSHPHSDHFGGMYRIADRYDVKNIIFPDMDDTMFPATTSFTKLIDTADKKGIPMTLAMAGDRVELSENASIEILAPIKAYEDLNNSSLVVRFSFGETSFLFCGDIEEMAESDILMSGADISADVIKVPHHGSGTSSTKLFAQAVSAEYAVFCVGESNDYGHPHSNIVSLYRKLGAEILRTDRNGNIVFTTDGKSISVNKQKAA